MIIAAVQIDELRMSAEIDLRKQLGKFRYRTFYKRRLGFLKKYVSGEKIVWEAVVD